MQEPQILVWGTYPVSNPPAGGADFDAVDPHDLSLGVRRHCQFSRELLVLFLKGHVWPFIFDEGLLFI